MILRVVRMHFTEDGAEEFLDIYNRTKDAIIGIDGCQQLELLNDIDSPHTFITLSHWTEKSVLEEYRHSELFKSVWGRLKPLFSKPAEAYSLEKYMDA